MKKILLVSMSTAIVLGTLTTNISYAKTPTPGSMAAMGDSITAAALAGFSRTDAQNPTLLAKVLYYLTKYGFQGAAAFNSPERSWSTGMGNVVRSHAKRLNELANLEGYNLGIYNAAVSGTNSNNLMEQTNAVINWSSKNLRTKSPDYVTIAMGPNDICSKKNEWMTAASTYGNNLRNSVFKLLDTNKNSRILINGIPNVVHLKKVAQYATLAGVAPLQHCQQIWELHHFCDNVLLEETYPEKLLDVEKRMKDYQEQIKIVTDEANSRFGADRVRNALSINDYKFTADDISIDCFHPNWKGQNILSNESWKQTWWAKDKW